MRYILLFLLFCFSKTTNAQIVNTYFWKVSKQGNPDSYIFGFDSFLGNSFFENNPEIKRQYRKAEVIFLEYYSDKISYIDKYNWRSLADEETAFTNYFKQKEINLLDSLFPQQHYNSPKFQTPGKVGLLTFLRRMEEMARWSLLPKQYYSSLSGIDISYYLASEYLKGDQRIIYTDTIAKKYVDYEICEKKEDTANMPERIIKYAHILSSQIKGTDKTLINIKKQNSETINYLDRKINYHFSNSIKERKQFNINTERANTIVKRNTNWVDLFDKELLIKNTFIAVNIVHLYYKEGILSQLKNKGYTVEPVFLK